MIEGLKDLNGAIIKKITSYTDDDVIEGEMVGEYCAYRLVVETDKGTFIYEGCHDYTPDMEVINLDKDNSQYMDGE